MESIVIVLKIVLKIIFVFAAVFSVKFLVDGLINRLNAIERRLEASELAIKMLRDRE